MRTDHAGRARALVGTRFRPQGRDPRLGVDCLGMLICVFDLAGEPIRRDYRLRGDHRRELEAGFQAYFRRVRPSRQRPGDVLLMRVAPDQFHVAITTERGFVHADARLGMVVETAGRPRWPTMAIFRRRVRKPRHS